MSEHRARRIAFWSLIAWGVTMLLALIFSGGSPGILTILGAVLIAAATALVLSWVTSMIAGPFALVKMRRRPDTLGVYTRIILPLSLGIGLILAIAVPVHWTHNCVRRGAVVPLITAPIYLLGSPSDASIAYFKLADTPGCS
jgi:hypothetical protein